MQMNIARVITVWDFFPQGLALLGFAAAGFLLCAFAVSGSRSCFVREWGLLFAFSVFVGGVGLFWHLKRAEGIADSNRKVAASRDIEIIEGAAFVYFLEVGSWPHGDNATVVRLLVEHEGKDAILPVRKFQISEEGAALDPWGTPYYLEISEQKGLKAYSAGPDRIKGTSDDYPDPEK